MKPTDQLLRQERIEYWQRHLDFLFNSEKIITTTQDPKIKDTTKRNMSNVTKLRINEFKEITAYQLN